MTNTNKPNFATEKRKAIANMTHQSKANKVLIGFLALSSGLSLISGGVERSFLFKCPVRS